MTPIKAKKRKLKKLNELANDISEKEEDQPKPKRTRKPKQKEDIDLNSITNEEVTNFLS
jgi:hypothetical protein